MDINYEDFIGGLEIVAKIKQSKGVRVSNRKNPT